MELKNVKTLQSVKIIVVRREKAKSVHKIKILQNDQV